MLEPHPDWSLLGVIFKISDEHPRPFYIGSPPPRGNVSVSVFSLTTSCVIFFYSLFIQKQTGFGNTFLPLIVNIWLGSGYLGA